MNNIDDQKTFTADEFLDKLKKALSKDGDFPASARVVNELKSLTGNPNTTANQVTEAILKEPSLGIRVLHLVNSTFYRRAQPIMTVSQAVMQIGMKPLAELCAGLVLLQKFVPAARSGGAFANCLQKTLLSSLLSSSLSGDSGPQTANSQKTSESGYLAGTFAEIGPLLLAFYFPQIYENAIKRSEVKKQPLEKSIQQLTGLTPNDLSKEVLKSLELPNFYVEVINASETIIAEVKSKPVGQQQEVQSLSKVIHAAMKISNVLVYSKDKGELDRTLGQLNKKLDFDVKALNKVLGDLPSIFQSHCEQIDLSMPPLPEYMSSYSESTAAPTDNGKKPDQDQFTQFVNEIRQAVENREPTASIITTVMETLAWGLKFDRVLLLLVNPAKRKLVGRMLLGNVTNFDPTKFERPLGKEADPHSPDAKAFSQGSPVFTGDPLFSDGWPIVAAPIGFGGRAIGVIYADRKSRNEELTAREQAAITVLTELLDRSVGMSG
jgi:HD-like signal output (HDOD) protein